MLVVKFLWHLMFYSNDRIHTCLIDYFYLFVNLRVHLKLRRIEFWRCIALLNDQFFQEYMDNSVVNVWNFYRIYHLYWYKVFYVRQINHRTYYNNVFDFYTHNFILLILLTYYLCNLDL